MASILGNNFEESLEINKKKNKNVKVKTEREKKPKLPLEETPHSKKNN